MSHAENISRLPALFMGSNKETEKKQAKFNHNNQPCECMCRRLTSFTWEKVQQVGDNEIL